ncbi:DUF3037 domain-containing protein [Aureispira anguillae]|uniref:DUF3037 domain-containing protein n=1 Tax=Aureispira anguillae TaxID=2864201 RepID=A0A915YM62_9BACT|nr:DUF3037 domain-containing protein [Aureispira anguillae]BDS15487.1 DUF3037 domain-containing protein [Aureispira anguillae]
MTKTFKYSVLKYRPSYLLEEQVNIGLLFLFLDDNKISFIYPKKLRRLTQFYPNTNLKNLKHYLHLFEQKGNKLDVPFINDNFSHFIEANFLAKDASNLYFSPVKNGVYKSTSPIIEHYNKLYFSAYEGKAKQNKKDEAYLRGTFKSTLEQILINDKERINLFKSSLIIKNKIGRTEFDYGWQNGTTNLVKFLSFDLADKGNLQDKSFRWYGEFSQLEEQAQNDNLKLDLLLTKPQNKALFSSYDDVLQVLEGIPTNKAIIEENQLKDYVLKATETVKPFTNRALLENQKHLK